MKHNATQKRHRVGDPSSKYGYCPWQLDADVCSKKATSEALYQEFRGWMMARSVTPDGCRYMFIRLYNEFLEDDLRRSLLERGKELESDE